MVKVTKWACSATILSIPVVMTMQMPTELSLWKPGRSSGRGPLVSKTAAPKRRILLKKKQKAASPAPGKHFLCQTWVRHDDTSTQDNLIFFSAPSESQALLWQGACFLFLNLGSTGRGLWSPGSGGRTWETLADGVVIVGWDRQQPA